MNHCHWNFQTFFRSTNTKTYWYVGHILKNSIGSTICDPSTKSGAYCLPGETETTHPQIYQTGHVCISIWTNTTKLHDKEILLSQNSVDGRTVEWRGKLDLKENVGFGQAETKVNENNLTLRKSTAEGTTNGEQSARAKAYVFNKQYGVKITAEETKWGKEEFQGPAKWNLLLSTWSN